MYMNYLLIINPPNIIKAEVMPFKEHISYTYGPQAG